jgi:hypothetical protein
MLMSLSLHRDCRVAMVKGNRETREISHLQLGTRASRADSEAIVPGSVPPRT